MARTKVNNDYFYNGWLLPFTVQPNVVVNEPIPFRYRNVLKGEFTGSQIIQGWLNVDSSKVIATDSELDKRVKYKFLETKDRQIKTVRRLNVNLELGAFDDATGVPLTGVDGDVRSVSNSAAPSFNTLESQLIAVTPDTKYQFNLIGLEQNEGLVKVFQYTADDIVNVNDFEEIIYNEVITTLSDTAFIKLYANDLFLDSSDDIITTYRIGEPQLQYVSKSEVLNIQIETIENQKYGIIRGRTDTNEYVLQLS
jgi:hypothetical protein